MENDIQKIQHIENRLTANEQAILNLNSKLESFEKHVIDEFKSIKSHAENSENRILNKIDGLNKDVSSKGQIDWRLAVSIVSFIAMLMIAVVSWGMSSQQQVALNQQKIEDLTKYIDAQTYKSQLALDKINQIEALSGITR